MHAGGLFSGILESTSLYLWLLWILPSSPHLVLTFILTTHHVPDSHPFEQTKCWILTLAAMPPPPFQTCNTKISGEHGHYFFFHTQLQPMASTSWYTTHALNWHGCLSLSRKVGFRRPVLYATSSPFWILEKAQLLLISNFCKSQCCLLVWGVPRFPSSGFVVLRLPCVS